MIQPKKIFITGGAGVGKTTLARRLASELNIPYHDLDDVMWNFGEIDIADRPRLRQQRVDEIVNQPNWVAEGSYVGPAQKIWSESDQIIFLELNTLTALWRIFLRHTKAEINRNNPHPGWRNLFKFMKDVFKLYRDPRVGDLDSDNDDPKLTLARLVAKREQFTEKLVVMKSKSDFKQNLALIGSK